MMNERERQFSDILRYIAESLDIPPSKYEQAVQRYTKAGEWLEAGQYPGATMPPVVYAQGSFRLGTVVRPVREGEEADYDIDLVCELQLSKAATSPGVVKRMVGDRLAEKPAYKRMLDEEGKRCWTLEYAEEDGIGFHMDILPAVPEDDDTRRKLNEWNVPVQYSKSAIAVTDKEGSNYTWDPSNPRGFAEWFDDQKLIATERAKQALVEGNVYASVDLVPRHEVKTPLQRCVQLLKRHRDMRFCGHKWEKESPISMIITTLAAGAYENEGDVYVALQNIVERIMNYEHTQLIRKRNGEWYMPNPVNEGENFAERWNEPGSHRAEAFFLWLQWLKEDISMEAATKKGGIHEIGSYLSPFFGKAPVQAAIGNVADQYTALRESGTLKMAAGTGTLGITGSDPVKRHTFYGD